MERLNERQREILTYLDEVYPNNLNKEELLIKLRDETDNVLPDIKLLAENKLVDLIYGVGDSFPSILTITPKGKEKLQENFFKLLKESAYNNPLTVVTIVIEIVGKPSF